jgi:hypothetical protein
MAGSAHDKPVDSVAGLKDGRGLEKQVDWMVDCQIHSAGSMNGSAGVPDAVAEPWPEPCTPA